MRCAVNDPAMQLRNAVYLNAALRDRHNRHLAWRKRIVLPPRRHAPDEIIEHKGNGGVVDYPPIGCAGIQRIQLLRLGTCQAIASVIPSSLVYTTFSRAVKRDLPRNAVGFSSD